MMINSVLFPAVVKFSFPKSFVIRNTLLHEFSAIKRETWPHVPFPVDKHAINVGIIAFLALAYISFVVNKFIYFECCYF